MNLSERLSLAVFYEDTDHPGLQADRANLQDHIDALKGNRAKQTQREHLTRLQNQLTPEHYHADGFSSAPAPASLDEAKGLLQDAHQQTNQTRKRAALNVLHPSLHALVVPPGRPAMIAKDKLGDVLYDYAVLPVPSGSDLAYQAMARPTDGNMNWQPVHNTPARPDYDSAVHSLLGSGSLTVNATLLDPVLVQAAKQ